MLAGKKKDYYCFEEELSEALEEIALLIESYEAGQDMNQFSWQITTLYQGRNQIYRIQKANYDLVVKSFACPTWFKQAYYGWGRCSKARRSFQNSIYLQELNVGVAPARAFIEEYNSFGLLQRSYYISDYLEHFRTDLQWIMRGWSAPSGLLSALASFIINLHELGIEDKDLSAGNILYQYKPEAKQYEFSLVDVNRMNFQPFPLSRSLSLKNLERLCIAPSVSTLFAQAYAEERQWNTAQTIRSLNQICNQFWGKRLYKLARRQLRREHNLSYREITSIYLRYRWTRLKRKFTGDKEKKAQLFTTEERLYQTYFQAEDLRSVVAKREGYHYRFIPYK